MSLRSLVTVATDGFRDYVDLPDGRQVNLGSVSVLKLITSLVKGDTFCRRALDAFLKKGRTVISVDIGALEELLKPKRSRWASYEDPFIPIVSQQLRRGMSMDPDLAQSEAIKSQIAEIEKQIALIEQTAKEHASGSQSDQQLSGSIDSLRSLITELGKEPKGQSDNGAFYFKLGALEGTLAQFEKASSVTDEEFKAFELIVSSLSEVAMGKTAAVDETMYTELDLYIEHESSLYPRKKNIIENLRRKMEVGRYRDADAKKLWRVLIDEGAEKYGREFHEDIRSIFPQDLRDKLVDDFKEHYEKALNTGEYGNVTPKAKTAEEQVQNQQQDQGQQQQDKTATGEVKGPAEDVAKQTKVDDPYAGKPLSDNDTYYKLGNETDVGDGPVSGNSEEVAKTTKVDNPYAGKDQSKNETYYKLASADLPFINEAIADAVMTRVESALKVVEASTKKGASVARNDLSIITTKVATLLKETRLDDPSLSQSLRKLSGMVDKIRTYFV